MDKSLEPLKDKSLLIIFAYAPAGLGHLRVTDALYQGLPKDINTPLILGSQDETITYLHRLMSLNPLISFLANYFGCCHSFCSCPTTIGDKRALGKGKKY